MNINKSLLSAGLLLVLSLVGCGGGGGDTSSSDTLTPSSSNDVTQLLVDTGDSNAPLMLLDDSGMMISVRADTRGQLSGLTLIGATGEISDLSIDETTGFPSQLTTEYGIVLFENVRADSGLVDLALIDPDGEVQYIDDVSYLPPSQAISANTSGDTPDETEIIEEIDLIQLSNNIQLERRLTRADATEELPASAASKVQFAACAITAAAVVGLIWNPPAVVAFQAVPIVGPIFGALAGPGAIAGCTAAAFDALRKRAENPDHVALTGPQGSLDALHVAGRVYDAVGPCASGDYVKCAMKSGAIAFSTLNSTAKRSYATILQARALMDSSTARLRFGVYCCDGPTKVELGGPGRWRVLVDDSESPATPYTFSFDFDDGDIPSVIRESSSSYRMSNRYYELGEHEIKVKVTDLNLTSVSSTDFGDPFIIEAVGKDTLLDANCCEGNTKVHVNQTGLNWLPEISGGVGPYRYTLYWGDEKTNTYRVEKLTDITESAHTYLTTGTATMKARVTDSLGDEDTSSYFSVEVIDPLTVSCCNGAIGARVDNPEEWEFQVQDVVKPYRYEISWGDGSNNTIVENKRVTRVTESHTYTKPGKRKIVVMITDASGAEVSSEAFNITVVGETTPAPVQSDTFSVALYRNFDETTINLATNPGFSASNADIWLTGTLENLVINWRGGDIAALSVTDIYESRTGYAYAVIGNDIANFENNLASPLNYGDYSVINASSHDDALVPAKTLEANKLYSIQVERFSGTGSKSDTESAVLQFRTE